KSLYALTSRIFSVIHSTSGRQKGFKGFILNDLLMKTEQIPPPSVLKENFKEILRSFDSNVPEAEIVLSSKDTKRKLAENDDVQFECIAEGEPSVNKIQFLRERLTPV
ncbi:hypothetical protein Anas_04571, partial [Armadillidium nasatum]